MRPGQKVTITFESGETYSGICSQMNFACDRRACPSMSGEVQAVATWLSSISLVVVSPIEIAKTPEACPSDPRTLKQLIDSLKKKQRRIEFKENAAQY